MRIRTRLSRNITLAVTIAVIIVSAVAVGTTFTSANVGPRSMAAYGGSQFKRMNQWDSGLMSEASDFPMNRGFMPPRPRQGPSGNVTIDSAQAKVLVTTAISGLKVGTVASSRTGWLVPVENEKGVIVSIQVTKISAATADQAKRIVEDSLNRRWKVGEAKLAGTIYNVPLLDSNDSTIGEVRVDGKAGTIMTRPSTILTVTIDQAKSTVSNAISGFTVGDVKDRGNSWIVSIKYNDKVVMTVVLGKLTTSTSDDAIKTIQASMGKGWKVGEVKALQSIFNVSIFDANGATIGSVMVDGRNGNIGTGFGQRALTK